MQPSGPRNPLFLREEELDRSLELLFRVQAILGRPLHGPLGAAGLGPIDYLLLFLVRRRPGLTGADLVGLTGLPKQNLSRHLAALDAAGLVARGVDAADRRRRPLASTAAADRLLDDLLGLQKRHLRRVFRKLGPEAVEGFQQVLSELVGPDGRGAAPASSSGGGA
ncbi:MAG: MarR family transcriptional regulator [Geminicoccaceae bacterium]|nr:MarR family transcriptional regulator [Geminicoccaceae bacterium]